MFLNIIVVSSCIIFNVKIPQIPQLLRIKDYPAAAYIALIIHCIDYDGMFIREM